MRQRNTALMIIGVFIASAALLLWWFTTPRALFLIRYLTLPPHSPYQYVILGLIGLGLLGVIASLVYRSAALKPLKLMRFGYFILLLPVALLPLVKCWFKLPYIFCRICPRKCVFGYIRSYGVPMAVFTNLKGRFFCYNICPIGRVQSAQASLNRKIIRRNSLIASLGFLIIATLMYFFVHPSKYPAMFDVFFNGAYVFSIGTAIVAGIIFVASFFVSRVWCDNICPIGGLARIYLKIKNRVSRIGKG